MTDPLALSYAELAKMSDAELQAVKHALGRYIDTPQEAEAKRLNNLCVDLQMARYGWQEYQR